MKDTTLFQRFHRGGRSAGFTLIEMMVVIGIIGILTALTGVALRGLNGSTSRHTAVNTLMGVLDQARMVAISDGRPTYVVFVSAPSGQSTGAAANALPDTMWGRAYALFEDPELRDGMSVAAPVQRSNWLYLPTGIAFKCGSADGTPQCLTSAPQSQRPHGDLPSDNTTFNVQSRANGSTTLAMTLPYVKFDATGQIVDCTGYVMAADADNAKFLRMLLFEGIATRTGAEVATHTNAQRGSNDKKYSFDEILLKPTTGRAAYTLNPVNNLATNQ